jgi:hypothetical protein
VSRYSSGVLKEEEECKGERENGRIGKGKEKIDQSRCSKKAFLMSFERFDSLPTDFVDPNLLHNPLID